MKKIIMNHFYENSHTNSIDSDHMKYLELNKSPLSNILNSNKKIKQKNEIDYDGIDVYTPEKDYNRFSNTPSFLEKKRINFSPKFTTHSKIGESSPYGCKGWFGKKIEIEKPKNSDNLFKTLFQKTNKKIDSPEKENSFEMLKIDNSLKKNHYLFTTSPPEFNKILEIKKYKQNKENKKKKIINKTINNNNLQGCNCRNSKCLKLYCDCLRNGNTCLNCNCTDCENYEGSKLREEKINKIKKKNPNAFQPLFEKTLNNEKMHSKGCNCKRSNCLKNYCECHQNGIVCGKLCNCYECKNNDVNSFIKKSKMIGD